MKGGHKKRYFQENDEGNIMVWSNSSPEKLVIPNIMVPFKDQNDPVKVSIMRNALDSMIFFMFDEYGFDLTRLETIDIRQRYRIVYLIKTLRSLQKDILKGDRLPVEYFDIVSFGISQFLEQETKYVLSKNGKKNHA